MKKLIYTLIAVFMIASLSLNACAPSAATSEPAAEEPVAEAPAAEEPATEEVVMEPELDYQFGLNETFHSDEPVTYTMYFSDASWDPMVVSRVTFVF